MRSPFPGMDPYLERRWQAVHTVLIGEIWRALNRVLPSDLAASVEERVAIEADKQQFRAGPDVFVFEAPESGWTSKSATAVAVDAPFKIVVELEPVIERSVEVINQDGQVITVIEVISPANKMKPGIDAYRNKRKNLIAAGVHVVEIDLVRAGNWEAMFLPHTCPANATSLYRVTIRVAESPAAAYLYPIHLADTLPDIQIPLRVGDPKVTLSLQPLLDAVYVDGRYSRTLDYKRPLDPPLSVEDQAYVTQRLAAAGG